MKTLKAPADIDKWMVDLPTSRTKGKREIATARNYVLSARQPVNDHPSAPPRSKSDSVDLSWALFWGICFVGLVWSAVLILTVYNSCSPLPVEYRLPKVLIDRHPYYSSSTQVPASNGR
jgi:hypothetical protein